MKLYYCGGKGGTLHRVLKDGFQSKDMVAGDYGVGLYFTQSPVRAMQYSEVGFSKPEIAQFTLMTYLFVFPLFILFNFLL